MTISNADNCDCTMVIVSLHIIYKSYIFAPKIFFFAIWGDSWAEREQNLTNVSSPHKLQSRCLSSAFCGTDKHQFSGLFAPNPGSICSSHTGGAQYKWADIIGPQVCGFQRLRYTAFRGQKKNGSITKKDCKRCDRAQNINKKGQHSQNVNKQMTIWPNQKR